MLPGGDCEAAVGAGWVVEDGFEAVGEGEVGFVQDGLVAAGDLQAAVVGALTYATEVAPLTAGRPGEP